MMKSLERALAEVASLPEADQEAIGRKLLTHVEQLRRLRIEIDKGLESLNRGGGTSLDSEEFLRRKNETHGGA